MTNIWGLKQNLTMTTNFKNVKNNNTEPPIIEESKCICLWAIVVNDFCLQIGWKLLSADISRRMKTQHKREKD